MIPQPRLIASALLLAACGCATAGAEVAIDPARLEAASAEQVACAYRLREVVDARPSGDQAGALSGKKFVFDDVAGVVRGQLIQAGLSDTDDSAPTVGVRILRFYISQSNSTKIAVVVYEATIDQQQPVLIRSQQASANWNGSQNEAYAALSRALLDANRQLRERLNKACPVTP